MLKLLLLLVILISPNFLPTVERELNSSWGFDFICALSFWMLFFSLFNKIKTGVIFSLPFILLLIPSFYLRLNYQVPITPEFFGMAMETNINEVHNFVSILGFKLIFFIFFVLFIWIYFVAYSHKSNYFILGRYRALVILSMAILLILIYLLVNLEKSIDSENNQQFAKSQDPFVDLMISPSMDRWRSVYPLDIFISWAQVKKDKDKVNYLRESLGKNNLSYSSFGFQPDIVVMVIGESSRRDRWSLFGYYKKTTPNLDAMDNIIKINNVVSISTATRSAVPALISRRPFYGPNGAFSEAEHSVLSAFASVGYSTTWISNQSASGFYDTPIAFYAKDAQNIIYVNPSSFNRKGQLDGELLPHLKNAINKDAKKKFIVIHSMGSHFNYSYRYPKDFEFFKPAMNAGDFLLKSDISNKVELGNSYDNTVLYTDYILSEIIKYIADKKSLMIYASDHGEDLIDEGCSNVENGRNSDKSFEIPIFFWFSESYKKVSENIYGNLEANKNNKNLSKALPQTILDISGVKASGKRTASLLDDQVNAIERIVYSHRGWVDFDKAKIKNNCYITP